MIFVVLLLIALVAISFAFVNIITIFQGDIVTNKLIISLAAKGQLLTATLFIIACDFVAVNIVVSIFVGNIIEIDGSCSFLVIQPRTSVAKVVVFVILAAKLPTNINLVTSTAEVFITNGNHAYEAISVAVASANTKGAGVHFYNVDFYLDRVRLTTGIQLYVYIFKIAQIIHALHAATSILRIERLARL